ncbi:hypothetical protein [Streptomyces sp. NPDC002889]|uniref:hypothetical protein n=1 Tax=Streptomyces sp. NPDC002889 TaxID=3364669 RepID=UPI003682F240
MRRATPARTAAWAAAASLVLASAAAGCSESGGGESSSPAPSVTAPSVPSGPADPAAAEQEIRTNWSTFFDPGSSADQRVRVLENGESLRPALESFGKDSNAAQATAEVKTVQFISPTEANVTFDVLVNGTPVLPGTKGSAVLQEDIWKVSRKTLCTLVRLSGSAELPGC